MPTANSSHRDETGSVANRFKFVPGFDQKIKAGVMKTLQRGALRLSAQIMNNLATDHPPSSRSSDYPRRRTGQLFTGIDVKENRANYAWHVTSTAPHAIYVEHSRPYMSRTLKESGDAVLKSMARDGLKF